MKHKFTFVGTVEFDVDPENYPDCETDEERLVLDLESANDDPVAYFDDVNWEITGELVP